MDDAKFKVHIKGLNFLICCLLINLSLLLHFRILLSELHEAYFMEPGHAQRVLAKLRFKQAAQTLEDVEEVCYWLTKGRFCLHACTAANVA